MPKKHARVQPIERFPVKPRADGRFQKRIRGRLHYFGDGSADRSKALAEYNAVKDDLYAGRVPKPAAGTYSLGAIAEMFLADKEGEVSADHYRQHVRALSRFVKRLGDDRIGDPSPDDFASYGRYLRGKLGPYAYNRERASILCMYNHAEEQDWIARAPKFGKGFKRAPKRELRAGRKVRLLSRDEINALLGHAVGNLYAMILLGLNGGFGARDCATLHWDKIDMDRGVCTHARAKNGIPRTVMLWPETLHALKRLKRINARVFNTQRGGQWNAIAIAHRFEKCAKAAEVKLPKGVGLGACRHTFATFANEVRDTDARRHIMGRLLPNLDDLYVEMLFEQRLKAVTDHVRARLNIAEMISISHVSCST